LDPRDKRYIGSKTCKTLLEKIHTDLVIARQQDGGDIRFRFDESHAKEHDINTIGRRVRTRLYFTSESHLHTLINCLRYPPTGCRSLLKREARRLLGQIKELSYLTMIVFQLYEDPFKSLDDPSRFRVEILFTPGVTSPPDFTQSPTHPGASYPSAFGVEPIKVLQNRLRLEQVERYFDKICNQVSHPDNNIHFIRSPSATPPEPEEDDGSREDDGLKEDAVANLISSMSSRTVSFVGDPTDKSDKEEKNKDDMHLDKQNRRIFSLYKFGNIFSNFLRACSKDRFSSKAIKITSVLAFGFGLVAVRRLAYRRQVSK